MKSLIKGIVLIVMYVAMFVLWIVVFSKACNAQEVVKGKPSMKLYGAFTHTWTWGVYSDTWIYKEDIIDVAVSITFVEYPKEYADEYIIKWKATGRSLRYEVIDFKETETMLIYEGKLHSINNVRQEPGKYSNTVIRIYKSGGEINFIEKEILYDFKLEEMDTYEDKKMERAPVTGTSYKNI